VNRGGKYSGHAPASRSERRLTGLSSLYMTAVNKADTEPRHDQQCTVLTDTCGGHG